jgi:hypothetical protein
MQNVVETQETSESVVPRLGLAIGWAAHCVPFQLSATGEWLR